MEAGTGSQPLKVCRHCSVASRGAAATCPSCGKPYERRRPQWRWWMAIPIVALAFAAGYFGLSRLIGDDEAQITVKQARAVEPKSSAAELEDQLGASDFTRERGKGAAAVSCSYYGLADQPDAAWEFCFRDDELISSAGIGDAEDPAQGLGGR